MANSQSNEEQLARSRSTPGYGLPDKAAPLPRQWQLPQPQTAVLRSQGGIQHFYPGPAGAGHWRQPTPSRRMERAILLGLWLLVMLTATAIGLRMFDLSGSPAAPTEALTRLPVSDDDADATRSAVRAAPRPEDSDPFYDIVPAPVLPEPAPTAMSAPMPARRLTPAVTLAIEPPAASLPVAAAGRASREPVCADAIRAMQLCPD